MLLYLTLNHNHTFVVYDLFGARLIVRGGQGLIGCIFDGLGVFLIFSPLLPF